jgi:phage shock protein A
MFKRIARITKANGNKLIKKFEKSECVIKAAREELRDKAGSLKLKSEQIRKRSTQVNNVDVQKEMETLAAKLEVKATEYKDMYNKYGEKLDLIFARKLLAEETLSLMSIDSNDDSALDLFKSLEQEVENMELEIKAQVELWG